MRGVPATLSIFWAVMLGVSDVGVLAGTYIVTGARWALEERRRGPSLFVVQAATVCAMAKRSKHFIMEMNEFCRFMVPKAFDMMRYVN